MSLKSRLARLRARVAHLPAPGQIDLIVCGPPGDGMIADGRPPGVYFNADGRVATVVFEGSKPDEKILERLRSRQPNWGTVIVCNLDPLPPPADFPAASEMCDSCG